MTETPNFSLPLPSLGQAIVGETGHVAELGRALRLLDQFLALQLSGAFVSTDQLGDLLSDIRLRQASVWSEPLTQSLLFAGTLDDLVDAGGVNTATWSPQLVFQRTELKDFIFRRPKSSGAAYRLHINLGDRRIASWPLIIPPDVGTRNGWTQLSYSHSSWDLWQYTALPEIEVHNVVVSVQSRTRNAQTEWNGRVNIADGSLRGDTKLQDASVGTAKIADGAITNSKVASGALDGDRLADNTITGQQIKDGAVNIDQIADAAIIDRKVTTGTINGNKLVNNSVTSQQIAGNAITSTEVANNAITARSMEGYGGVAQRQGIRSLFIGSDFPDTIGTEHQGAAHIKTGTSTQTDHDLRQAGLYLCTYAGTFRKIATKTELLGESDVAYLGETENSGLINSPDNGRFAIYTAYGSKIYISANSIGDDDVLQFVVRRSTSWQGRHGPPIIVQWKDIKNNQQVNRSTRRGIEIAPRSSLRTIDEQSMYINFSSTNELVFQFQDLNDLPSRNTFQIKVYKI